MNIKHQGKLPWCFLISGGQGITAIKFVIEVSEKTEILGNVGG